MENRIATVTELDSKYQLYWKRSQAAMEKENWDYAIDLLLPIVKDAPAFLDGRKVLRCAEVHAAGSRKSFDFGLSLLSHLSKGAPWETIADLEEKVFQKAPLSTSANQKLFDLANQLNFPDLATFALETILTGQPENIPAMHALAQHYLDHENPAKAAEIYAAIVKLDPADRTAAKGEKDAITRVSIEQGGWDNQADDPRPAVTDRDEPKMLDSIDRQGRTPEQTHDLLTYFTGKYEQEPDNLTYLKALGRLYSEFDDLELSLKFYVYAHSRNPGDTALADIVSQIQDKIQARYLDQLEAYITANPALPDIADLKANLATLRQQRSLAAISEARSRIQRNPTDKQAHYDLAQACFQAQMYSEAIPALQQARGNPHIRIRAMFLLGLCYEKKDMDDLAQLALEETLAELPEMDDLRKDVLYELALVHEKLEDPAASLKALKELYHADYGYKDVAQRVESSYTSRKEKKTA